MGKLLQVRDVPEGVHRTLKARAAQSGMSLSEYLRGELALLASRPTPDEILQRLRRRTGVELPESESPTKIIRKLRGALT